MGILLQMSSSKLTKLTNVVYRNDVCCCCIVLVARYELLFLYIYITTIINNNIKVYSLCYWHTVTYFLCTWQGWNLTCMLLNKTLKPYAHLKWNNDRIPYVYFYTVFVYNDLIIAFLFEIHFIFTYIYYQIYLYN